MNAVSLLVASPFGPLGFWQQYGAGLAIALTFVGVLALPVIVWLIRLLNIESGVKAPSADAFEPSAE